MAGVVRLSSGRIVQKYFLSLATKNIKRNIKINQRICFHSTPFLDVVAQEVNMPSLSPTMTTGTIVQWLKKEGDNVVPGDVLCEIQTDKAVMAFETEEEGILAKILVEPGAKDVKVGTLIALMVGEGEDWKRVEIPNVTASVIAAGFGSSSSPSSAGFSTSGSSSAPAGSSGDSKGSSGGTVPGQELKMPALSPTMTEGTIVSWKKKEGEKINPGDALCEIQTDKAIMSFEIEEEGILAKILVPAGTANVKVGTLIALTVEPDADWTQVRIPSAAGAAPAAPTPSAPAPVAAAPTVVSGTVRGQDVKMPALSPTMTEGTIISWKKKEGEKINPGDALCEIQTDKAVMTFEMEEEGVLAKILVPAGTANVKIGTLIALTVDEGQDWKDVMVTTGGPVSSAVTPGLPAAPPTVVAAMTGGSTPGTEVKMPALSPTMIEGVIVSWSKKEGDKLSPGDVLCEIQTDKAVMGFEIEEEAILAKILAPASSKVTVGALIALTVEEGKDWKDVAIPAAAGAPAPATAAPAPTSAAPAAAKPAAAPVHTGFHLEGDWAPAVRNLLETYQLTGKEVTATGRKKRVLKADVLKYIRDNNLQPKPPVPVPLPGKKGAPAGGPAVSPAARAPTARYTDKEVSSMRKTIASRLTQSKTQIPHAYSTLEARVDDMLAARKQLQNLGIKVSVNDFVLKAVSKALKQCPYVNTLYVKDEIKPSPTVDISVAVATESGLITPIIKNADQKTVDQISEEIRVLANKARQGKLQLHEFQGGSFTVSNLGMFGISTFSAIINPPQCAILAVGGGRQVIKLDGKPATVMSATLSYDGRAISDDEVAAFMEVLTGYLENPASLLLSSMIRPTVKLGADQRTT